MAHAAAAAPARPGPVAMRPIMPWEWLGLAVLTGLFALCLHLFLVPTFSGTDPNGYHVMARILAETGRTGRVPADDYEFIGRMWVVGPDGVCHAKYPPFYPALCALLIRLFGMGADLWANALLGLLAVPGMFLLAQGFGLGRWSLAAAALLALNPIFVTHALQQVSHASGLCMAIWGLAAWLWAMRTAVRPRALLLRLAAGILTGSVAGIRYPDALLALPLLAEAALRLRRRDPLPLAATLLGLALPWGILALHHVLAFGGPLTTGYALTGEQTGFAPEYFLANLRPYLRGIIESGLGPVAILVLPGLAVAWRQDRPQGILCLLWGLPLLLLYLAYYWAPAERHAGFLRFLLPVFVLAILLAVLAIRALAQGLGAGPRWTGLAAAGILVPQAAWGAVVCLEHAETLRQQGLRQQAAVALVESRVPGGSVLIAGQNLLNFLDYLGHWRLYPEEIFLPGRLRQMSAQAEGEGPSGLQRSRARWLKEQLADVPRPTYQARIDALLEGHLTAGRRIFLALPPNELSGIRLQLLRRFEMTPEAVLAATVPPPRLLPASGPRRERHEAMPSATVRLTLVELTGRRSRPLRPEEERDLLRTDLAERQRSLFRRDGGPLDDQLRDIESLRRRLQALDAVAPDAPSGQRPPRPRPRAGEKGPGPDRARK